MAAVRRIIDVIAGVLTKWHRTAGVSDYNSCTNETIALLTEEASNIFGLL